VPRFVTSGAPREVVAENASSEIFRWVCGVKAGRPAVPAFRRWPDR